MKTTRGATGRTLAQREIAMTTLLRAQSKRGSQGPLLKSIGRVLAMISRLPSKVGELSHKVSIAEQRKEKRGETRVQLDGLLT